MVPIQPTILVIPSVAVIDTANPESSVAVALPVLAAVIGSPHLSATSSGQSITGGIVSSVGNYLIAVAVHPVATSVTVTQTELALPGEIEDPVPSILLLQSKSQE